MHVRWGKTHVRWGKMHVRWGKTRVRWETEGALKSVPWRGDILACAVAGNVIVA